MTKIYALANQKGGVGKTTTAVNLAAYLAAIGRRVLVVDVDPQANATSSFGLDKNQIRLSLYESFIESVPLEQTIVSTNRTHLYLAPSAPRLAGAEVELVSMIARERLLSKGLQAIASRYEYVFIDTPPSLGLLTVNALTAAHGIIIPVQCEYLALEGLGELLNTIQLIRENLNSNLYIRGLVMTMYDARTNLAQQVVKEVRRHFGEQVFETIIPRSVRLSEAPSYGESILKHAPRSPGALAYAALTRELLLGDGVVPAKEKGDKNQSRRLYEGEAL
ncbi:MAG: sporulation initiation inhibitor Soj [Anaerolineaceae bacterium 4572_32.1]|nr:MAG: sporulation initiation inhibitor Soj [Anaerolineaceae bacterium 4572_32.1]